MKTDTLLPLVTYPDPNSKAVATNAAAMAVMLQTRLHALAINVDLPVASNAISRVLLDVPEMVRHTEATSRQHGASLIAAVQREADLRGVEVSANTISAKAPFIGDAVATHARYFDCVLCGWEARNATSASTAETLVFGSGRPTIVLPEHASVAAFDHAAIAWDGSAAAARAVGDAMPLLRRMGRITVLTVVDEKPLREINAAERLAGGLAKRGLNASAVPIRSQARPTAEVLQERALECGAGIMVMGAFGHSRLREFILGGVTDGVLGDARLPLLLSH